MRFNSEVIEEESGFKPERSYYCMACGGWHVTSSKESFEAKSRTEIALEKFRELKAKREGAKQLRTENRAKLDALLTKQEDKIEHLESTEDIKYDEAVADLKSISDLIPFSLKHHRERKNEIQLKLERIRE